MTDLEFSTLALSPEMLAGIAALGYQHMTPIQAQSLIPILEHKDIVAQAKTGSGKTAAFAIGILSKVNASKLHSQALVLCPTRELADQVTKEIKALARFLPNLKVLSLCGGKPLRSQVASLNCGAHIIVGTPGRILDHLQRQTLNLRTVHTLVLDEADRMLDMGFSEDIAKIIQELPRNRQTLLFSATFPEAIQSISKAIQNQPVQIKVDSTHDASQIEQIFYKVNESDRLSTLKALLQKTKSVSTLIFCTTKIQCDEIADDLKRSSLNALAIHGGLDQRDRDEVLVRFSNKSCSILVATDVASRGLDIKDLATVINYQLPRDPEVYIHRIGRTGRAGKKGQALSFYTAMEKRKISDIESFQKSSVVFGNVADLYCRDDDDDHDSVSNSPLMQTIKIAGGRKDKLCKGDILGALTGGTRQITASQVGKIDIFDYHSCVAIEEAASSKALRVLGEQPIKGRRFKVKIL